MFQCYVIPFLKALVDVCLTGWVMHVFKHVFPVESKLLTEIVILNTNT